MKQFFLILSSFFITSSVFAQKILSVENMQEWDPNRYENIQGSPYFFKNFCSGTIYDKNGEACQAEQLNLNGYTRNIEWRKGQKYIELDERLYPKIEITTRGKKGKTTTTTFTITPHAPFKGKYVQLLYDGQKFKLYNDFFANISEHKVETPGKTETVARFAPKHRYFLLYNGQLDFIKLKKKNIFETLGHKKEIESFAKKNKLKIESPEGLVKILTFLEEKEF